MLARRYKTADGTSLYYRYYRDLDPAVPGQPDPLRQALGDAVLVLNDGLGCDGFIWKYLLRDFAGRVPILHTHYRAHGRSAEPRELATLNLDQLADDVAAICAHEGIARAVPIGHSMGVQISLEMWRRHPALVAGLVLTCGSYGNPLASFHDSDMGERLLPTIIRALDTWPGEIPRLWAETLGHPLMTKIAKLVEVNPDLCREDDLKGYFEHLTRMQPRNFFLTLRSLNEHTAEPFLAQVDVPTLVIAAGRDRFTPMHLSLNMHRMIPGAELLVLSEGSHVAPIELPQVMNPRIERFVVDHARAFRPGKAPPRGPLLNSPAPGTAKDQLHV